MHAPYCLRSVRFTRGEHAVVVCTSRAARSRALRSASRTHVTSSENLRRACTKASIWEARCARAAHTQAPCALRTRSARATHVRRTRRGARVAVHAPWRMRRARAAHTQRRTRRAGATAYPPRMRRSTRAAHTPLRTRRTCAAAHALPHMRRRVHTRRCARAAAAHAAHAPCTRCARVVHTLRTRCEPNVLHARVSTPLGLSVEVL